MATSGTFNLQTVRFPFLVFRIPDMQFCGENNPSKLVANVLRARARQSLRYGIDICAVLSLFALRQLAMRRSEKTTNSPVYTRSYQAQDRLKQSKT